MSANALPFTSECCTPACPDEVLVQVPGTPGDDGDPGIDGAAGVNAFTTLGANFTMPAELAATNVLVGDSSWIGLNQILYLARAGFLQATALPDATHVTLKNLEDAGSNAYLDNVAPGTVIPSGSKLSPGGWQGFPGTASGAALLIANNLSDVANAATSRGNIHAAKDGANSDITSLSALSTPLSIAQGGTAGATAAAARTALGVAIGTNVQAWDADLDALAGLATAADKVPYFTALHTAALADLTSAGRALIDDASAAAQRATLNVLPRYGLLGSLAAADFNSTADQAITIASGVTRYVIRRIVVVGASISLTTAAGGVYGGAAKSAPIIVAAGQVYSALTAASKFLDLTLTALAGTDVFTQATLYLSLTTAQGAAATAGIYIFGEDLT